MKSSDAKASKCHSKFSSRMIIFIKLVYLSIKGGMQSSNNYVQPKYKQKLPYFIFNQK